MDDVVRLLGRKGLRHLAASLTRTATAAGTPGKFSGFDLFDDAEIEPAAPDTTETRLYREFTALERGDTFVVGGKTWEIFASQGVVKYCQQSTQSDRPRFYFVARPEGVVGDPTVCVYRASGSGVPVGPAVACGAPTRFGKTRRFD